MRIAVDAGLAERFLADLTARLHGRGLADSAIRVGVALSGGPDSVALLLLAAACGHEVSALTVDHGLRPESAAEAEYAAGIAMRAGVPHAIARVDVPRTASVQAAAREVRYAALARWAEAEGIAAILTAHHADDQAETLLMRLARGSGVAGLAGVRAHRRLTDDPGGVVLLRPLLGWRKAELEAIVSAAGIDPIRDPSNTDDRYDRTAARRLLAATPWLDADRLARSVGHLADADEALESIVDSLWPAAVEDRGDHVALTGVHPREITRRLMRRLFAAHFGKHPDGPALERLFAVRSTGVAIAVTDILCTCRLAAGRPEWRFRRAPPRRSP